MEKTYVFDTAPSNNFDSTALIASLMGNKGVDPNLMPLRTKIVGVEVECGGFG